MLLNKHFQDIYLYSTITLFLLSVAGVWAALHSWLVPLDNATNIAHATYLIFVEYFAQFTSSGNGLENTNQQ